MEPQQKVQTLPPRPRTISRRGVDMAAVGGPAWPWAAAAPVLAGLACESAWGPCYPKWWASLWDRQRVLQGLGPCLRNRSCLQTLMSASARRECDSSSSGPRVHLSGPAARVQSPPRCACDARKQGERPHSESWQQDGSGQWRRTVPPPRSPPWPGGGCGK